MSIYTCVTSSTRQGFVVLVGNMFSGFGISVSLRQTKIDHINDVLFFSMTNQEVVRLHISMDKVIIMEKFKSLNHLVRKHHGRFNCEFPLAIIEEIF